MKRELLNRLQRTRPIIGLQAFGLDRKQPLWLGAADAARKHNINLICFAGELINKLDAAIIGNDAIYDLLSLESLDGLITWAGQGVAVTRYLQPEEVKDYFNRFTSLPVVNYEGTVEGVPCVLTDTYLGMREVIVHLIEVHGRRRIALIRGPENHFETLTRVRAYTETLAEYGLPLKPTLVSPAIAEFVVEQGVVMMERLLDERKLQPKLDFDAVATTEVEFAHGALMVLQARGIHVPEEVAVVGFNDYLEDKAVTPPLTTVRKPFFEAGQQAVELLWDLLEGRQTPEKVNLPTELMVRQSCGCLSSAVTQAAGGPVVETGEPFEVVSTTRRESIVAELEQTAGSSAINVTPGWAERLLDAFAAEVRGESADAFLPALNDLLRQLIAAGSDVEPWHRVFSVLRRHTLPHLIGSREALARASDLWEQAQVMLGEIGQRTQLHHRLQVERQTATLRRIREGLTVTLNVEGLMDVLAEGLPQLGIPSCYLALYEQDSELATREPPPGKYLQPVPEWARLVLAYTENGRISLERGGQRFRSRLLVPADHLPQERGYTLIAQALHIQKNQLGFVMFELGPQEGWIYHALRGEISNALQAVRLTEQLKDRALQLQAAAAVARTVTSILELDELLPRIVDLIGQRFGYYYVAIFLVDETGSWAVLRAATGKIGQQLVQAGTRLQVDDQSIVGRVMATGEPYVAQDVSADPFYSPHASLPNTLAEAVMPLLSGHLVFGALDVESTHLNAFPQNAISILTTLADQIAVAIQNAKLHHGMTTQLHQTLAGLEQKVAELKQAEVEREALIAELESKNAELERFTYTVSHDLKSPLITISGFLGFLERDALTGNIEQVRTDITRVADAVSKMKQLLDELLELSRIGRLINPLEEVSLEELAREAVSMVAGRLGARGVEVDIAPNLPLVYGDRARLREVLQNLVDNAVKYMGDQTQPKVEISIRYDGAELVVFVRDNGLGIDPRYHQKVFGLFEQLNQKSEGSGIGLAIVKRIVEVHGGRIWVESPGLGRGSTFCFTLPGSRD